ncbi:MAG: urate hydroxylase PuuD, partial [Acidobacteriota bacterium]
MLSGSGADFQAIFSIFLQTDIAGGIHAPSGDEFLRILFRWAHFVAGITWIGILYFFNLVNVPLMKKLDGPTKKLVIPEMMPRALWFFRWGAVVTVLAGFSYFAMYIIVPNARNVGESPGKWIGLWLLGVLVLYAILYGALVTVNNGNVIAIIAAILVLALAGFMLYCFPGADNKTFSIGVGGGLGFWMLLNVWGIIWRAQKKIIAATIEGTPPPADLARKAYLASRANAWL